MTYLKNRCPQADLQVPSCCFLTFSEVWPASVSSICHSWYPGNLHLHGAVLPSLALWVLHSWSCAGNNLSWVLWYWAAFWYCSLFTCLLSLSPPQFLISDVFPLPPFSLSFRLFLSDPSGMSSIPFLPHFLSLPPIPLSHSWVFPFLPSSPHLFSCILCYWPGGLPGSGTGLCRLLFTWRFPTQWLLVIWVWHHPLRLHHQHHSDHHRPTGNMLQENVPHEVSIRNQAQGLMLARNNANNN